MRLTVRTGTTKDTSLVKREGTIVQTDLRRRNMPPAVRAVDIPEECGHGDVSNAFIAVIDSYRD
jgi:hypothetical protein